MVYTFVPTWFSIPAKVLLMIQHFHHLHSEIELKNPVKYIKRRKLD